MQVIEPAVGPAGGFFLLSSLSSWFWSLLIPAVSKKQRCVS